MTRKDYIVIAEALRIAYLNASNEMSLRDVNEVGSGRKYSGKRSAARQPTFQPRAFHGRGQR